MQFTFTIEQVNLILQGLAQMPYHMSANMITEIQSQAQPQLAEIQAEQKQAMQPGEPE